MVSVEDYENSDDEKRRDSARKRKARAQDRDVKIRRCANRKRREAALADVYSFLDLYFGHRFYNPFTKMHRDMVQEILYLAMHGGALAIAAPRGEGKTTIAECMMIYCVLRGVLKFPLILAATGPDADRILDNIKNEFETNELLGCDFPEVCDPIIALEGGTSRQNMQTVGGERTRLKWTSDYIVFPSVPKKYNSPCGGSIIMTRGIDAAIRGIRVQSQRPDLTYGDDLETRESAASEHQIETRKQTLLRDVGGLAGQGKRMATIITGTNQNNLCLMSQLSDPASMPAYNGRRYKLLDKMPENSELRDEYISKRQLAMTGGDPNATAANEFYQANQKELEAGGVILNPYRFVRESGEISAFQFCFNFIADKGMDAFLTECQNDPPDPSESDGQQITAALVNKRISGKAIDELPPGAIKLVAFADVMNSFLSCGDTAWGDHATGWVTNHYTKDVQQARTQQALDLAIVRVLHEWRKELLERYQVDGQTRMIDLALIDSGDGHHTNAVYQFCREVGHPFYPSKGMKDGWTAPKHAVNRGDHWAVVPQDDRFRTKLVQFESTFWKQQAQQRFVTPSFDENQQRRDGSLALFVCPDQAQFIKDRREFCHQVCGEVWGVKKIGARPGWIVRGRNHALDVMAGNCLAASICGVALLPEPATPAKRNAVMSAGANRPDGRSWL